MTPPATARRWRLGPGLLVTAAFIGPGTVTTATRAGGQFGFALLWTLLFAVLATIVLQEMAARLGLVTRQGLAEAIRNSIPSVWLRRVALALILAAIVLGNTAYQTGNLMGAGIGIHVLTGLPTGQGAALLGVIIAVVIAFGSKGRKLQAVLIAIVLLMSLAFLATAAVTKPPAADVVRGLTSFAVPEKSLLTMLALIGTTVVPYNLFLHATAVQKNWSADEDVGQSLRAARLDTVVAVAIGGLVTMAIVATAAATFFSSGKSFSDTGEFAQQLEPLFGAAGKALFAAGLAAAGVTSAITAPLAAGYAAAGTFPNASENVAKWTGLAVVLIGTMLAWRFGGSPQATIVIAQAANGLLLPLIAIFLLVVMNRRDLLGDYCNGLIANLLGAVVVLVACGLGLRSLASLVW